ncbi:integrase, partial [Salmonella enterica]|uniref:hypothetical protein n=1 Tax=Salmonella enterica TaxID=28901 RepID=UPI003D2A76FA
MIEATIDEVFLSRQRVRLVDLANEVRRRCLAGGLACPSRKAVTARVSARSDADVIAKRHGR